MGALLQVDQALPSGFGVHLQLAWFLPGLVEGGLVATPLLLSRLLFSTQDPNVASDLGVYSANDHLPIVVGV